MKKRILSLLLAIVMILGIVPIFSIEAKATATFDDINRPEVFLKQETGNTCTLSSATMLVRRTVIASGNTNWRSITESAMRGTAWVTGVGLRGTFSYAGVNVNSSYFGSGGIASQLISLLDRHPEGIVIYDRQKPHAILITDYTDGVFYCADPANNIAAGRIPVSQASIKVENTDSYWYVTSPQVSVVKDNAPIINLDSAEGGENSIHVSGWAFDPDTPSASLSIHVYINYNEKYIGACVANQIRTDVNNVYGCGDYHGFSADIPLEVDGVESYNITCYAINTMYGGVNTASNSIEVTVKGNSIPPVISNVQVEPDLDGYTVSCDVYDANGIEKVLFPSWSGVNGQDDLAGSDGSWPYLETWQGIVSNGKATFRVSRSDHNYDWGTYYTHIYAYDTSGNTSMQGVSILLENNPPQISDVKVAIDNSGYTVTCKVTDESAIKKVQFPTWSDKDGQDDLPYAGNGGWIERNLFLGTLRNGNITYRVNFNEHHNDTGLYHTHIYAFDELGNRSVYEIDNIEIECVASPIEQFVTRLYRVCLEREPDENGKNDWVGRLTRKKSTGVGVASGFIFSTEFKNKNLCNSDFVEQLYQAFMGRASDEDGKMYWVSKLESGMPREEIFNGFAMSIEFGNLCTSYGIVHGKKIQVPNHGTVAKGSCAECGKEDGVTAFVKRLYSICLNREADENGLNDWRNQLWTHIATGKQVAFGFIFSPEFVNRNLSNEEYVEYLYLAIMGRASDAGGKADWVNRLNNGWIRQDVFNGFAGSTEFHNICVSYGIVRE